MAMVLATPLGIAIGLYLSMMAPRRVRAVVGPLVEMLAAVPSIIYGFWGLVVLVPFIDKLEPRAPQRARLHPAVRTAVSRSGSACSPPGWS